MIKLRVLLAFSTYRVGDILEPASTMARQRLLALRFCGRPFVEEVSWEGPSEARFPVQDEETSLRSAPEATAPLGGRAPPRRRKP